MVVRAQSHHACFGARMTGAGFGGCAVALVDRNGVDAFVVAVPTQYFNDIGSQPAVYLCRPSPGASLEPA